MNSLILQSVSRVLIPIQITVALLLLLRGHNAPGGGFIAALVVATAVALHAIAFSPHDTRRLLRLDPVWLLGIGLMTSLVAGFAGLATGEPFLAGQWLDGSAFGLKFGTPLVFDIGVCVLVVGMTAAVMLRLMEDS